MPKDRFMLDTNIFNDVLDGSVPVETLERSGDLFVTPVQHQEISNTKNQTRRDKLLSVFKSVPAKERPLQTAVWGYGAWGGHRTLGQRGPHYDGLKQAMDALPKLLSKKRGNAGDSLTAEVCLSEEIALITNDPGLSEVARKFGVETLTLAELLARSKEEP